MPRTILRSAGHALRGIGHAVLYERNIRLFSLAYLIVLLFGLRMGLAMSEWLALLLAGGLFFAAELLNTALERIVDVVDDHLKQGQGIHCFEAVKIAKDVAAAASLVSLVVTVVVVALVFLIPLHAALPWSS